MKRRWVVVSLTCIALIGAGISVRAYRNHRRFAKRAAEYRVRAEQGDPKSQWALGAMYYYGKGVSKDYAEAVRWYRKSAEQGDPTGEYSLAHMYHYGKGVPQDDSEAERWCRKAAEQGNALAQDALGIIYRRCEGVIADDAEAVRWYRKSAEQGYPQAQYDLAWMYYYGHGVPRDRVQANDLFQQAAAHGNEDAKRALECDRKVSQSTPARAFGAFNNFVSAHDNCCRQAITLKSHLGHIAEKTLIRSAGAAAQINHLRPPSPLFPST
jgi:TPR repeat protein